MKPQAGKPAPPAKKPAPAKGKGDRKSKAGQVLVDLGFIEEDQLADLLREAQATGEAVEQVALSRGIINEEQLVQAISEQTGLKVVNLEEIKPQPDALKLVPETMATVYKILPLAFKDDVLTICMADPHNIAVQDDLRNLLGIKTVQTCLAQPRQIEEAVAKWYQGKEESIIDIIKELEADESVGGHAARPASTSTN